MTEQTPPSASAGPTEIAVRAVVLDSGRLLAVRDGDGRGMALPGGTVRPGEPLVQGLHRLLGQQLGARPNAADPIGMIEATTASPGAAQDGEPGRPGGLEIHQIFEVDLRATGFSDEGTGGAGPVWIPLERLAAEPLHPAGLAPALLHWLDTGRPFHSVVPVPGHAGGEPEGPFALRPYVRNPRQVTARDSARAVLLDDDDLIVFRRTVPGREVYWTTPGGRAEPEDPDLEATLRRELAEELGATVGPAVQVYTIWQQGGGIARIQHFFVCRLEKMDLSLRNGPEFDDPANGLHEVERVAFSPEGLRSIRLYPEQLTDYLAGNIDTIRRLV